MKKIIVVSGSPRKNGDTSKLVDEKTGDFAGRYVFSSSENAKGYGKSFAQKLVKKLCKPGKHHWWVENTE